MKKKSVVLLSGGLDSAANLAFCHEQDHPVLALTANYGQRAAERETQAAQDLARHYDVEHRIVDLRWLGELGGSALTDRSKAVPELKSTELDQMNTITQTAAAVWIPNRNGVLIQVAAAFAERRGAEQVVVGFNREEATTFPDNTVDFLERSTRALELSTSTQVRVACYTATFDKTEIVRALRSLKSPQTEFPFGKIWSCYEGADEPCGRCESCQRLKRALGNSRSGGGES